MPGPGGGGGDTQPHLKKSGIQEYNHNPDFICRNSWGDAHEPAGIRLLSGSYAGHHEETAEGSPVPADTGLHIHYHAHRSQLYSHPQFNSLYSAMGTSSEGVVTVLTSFLQLLPRLVLIAVSAAVVFAIIVMFIAAMKDVDRKSGILLFIPGVRFYFRNYQTYRFSREFGYFINNGLE